VIVPGIKKAAFIVGGQYGKGSLPAGLPLAPGGPLQPPLSGRRSFGFQIGGSETDASCS